MTLPFFPDAMFENLQNHLERAFKTLKGEGRITEINVAETVKEIRKALLEADVSYKVAKSFTDEVRQKALGQNVLTAVKPGQMLTKIVHDELITLMGSDSADIALKGSPAVVLTAGLQGSGKTTFAGKLAAHLRKKGRRPLLAACDIYRPAAIEQLKILGTQIECAVYAEDGEMDAVKIAKNAVAFAKNNNYNTLIIDTAGRLAIDEPMMKEVEAIKKAVQPSEILFVVDAMTGQDAAATAKEFNDRLDFDGVVLTKMDGDTRGGAALSIRAVVRKPIKFVSTGEKMDALQVFYPDRMAERILGMGDVVSLVERAQEQYDETEARRLTKRLAKNQFDYNDFLKQIHMVQKMGGIKDMLGMLPGAGKLLKNVNIDDGTFKGIEAIIGSMTPFERATPSVINGSRRRRIASGSGRSIEEVNRLAKQFGDIQKLMKNPAGASMQNMMTQMQNHRGM